MKVPVNKSNNFARIEFWAFATIFAFILFFFITNGLDGKSAFKSTPNKKYFDELKIPFSFYGNYFIPELVRYISLFLAFLYLNFVLVPRLFSKESLMRNIMLVVLVFIVSSVIFGITDTYLRGYLYATFNDSDKTNQVIFRDSFEYAFTLLMVFSFYTAIKYAGIYLLAVSETIQLKYSFIRREGIAASIIWMIGWLMLELGHAEGGIIVSWVLIIPSGILLYLAGFYRLVPVSLKTKYAFTAYLFINIVILLVVFPVTLVILTFTIHDESAASDHSFFNCVFQVFITVPLTWALFKRHVKGNEEMFVLKKELGRSTANLDFLRSQINPHFLFNALNTIYGTAIQEKAERTCEGIEKLGDMMRFMLQENMQEKISLNREIKYVNDYISLQRLRTDSNPGIQIQTHIQEHGYACQIAPMLLIPFVENAFKHGISLREPSHIRITLEIKDKTLYFDVHNSKHERPENDPEKDKSGIGLENVRQRLKLLYPNRHEMIIRETGREFFIHLTIQLA